MGASGILAVTATVALALAIIGILGYLLDRSA
jgi:preprotein translocase subunit Sss1